MIFERFNPWSDDETDESNVAPAMKDQPTTDDELGFDPYVTALEAFLTHDDTDPPLTLSVEGEWGMGKSSFMLQLEERLREHGNLTVQFNPWRHEREDALWAAFALQFFREVSGQIPFYRRWLGHLKLSVRRFRWKMGCLEMIRAGLVGVAIAVVTVLTPVVLVTAGPALLSTLFRAVPALGSVKNVVGPVLGTGGVALSLAGLVTLWLRITEQVVNPIETDLRKYVEKPEYEERVSFIEQFHADFRRILDSYIGDQRVYVFVDDLDRCEIPKAAELMQSINLMIATDPRLVFVVGMDREKVAAGISAKHESLLPYLDMSRLNDDRDTNLEPSGDIAFGYRYLEKFVQIPFLVPRPAPEDVNRLLLERENDGQSTNRLEGLGEATADETDIPEKVLLNKDSEILKEVVGIVAPALKYNPRKVKKFVNLLRLRAIFAWNNGLFDWMADDQYIEGELTIQKLAKFVAISLQWPRLLSELNRDPSLMKDLHNAATGYSSKTELGPRASKWVQRERLMKLLRAGNSPSSENPEQYSLLAVNFDALFQISPRVDRPMETHQRDATEVRFQMLEGFAERARKHDADLLNEGEILNDD
ncbi:KAP family P-loop NTPase fold protein [Halorussus salinus]|uniref:KAP family P-loop NTPase fold protein n=1 Tax=Halorussus salinus TaxID=1364935 RepID=UPI001091ADC0|nr:P-loop NTPase fold protein [Halorussus salinus]